MSKCPTWCKRLANSELWRNGQMDMSISKVTQTANVSLAVCYKELKGSHLHETAKVPMAFWILKENDVAEVTGIDLV